MKVDTVVRARISPAIKDQATQALVDMGLSVSDYIRMALVRVAHDKAIPFPVKVPNDETVQAMEKTSRGEDVHHAADAQDLFRKLGIWLRTASFSGQFKRDVKRAEKRGKDMAKLRHVLQLLIDGSPLPVRLRDHPLRSDWAGYRDLHIEPDWLLIYKIDATCVHLERTGTHSDLFRE